MDQYARLNIARFLSLISLVPIEIYVTFQMADNRNFYGYLGLSLVLPLFVELFMQAKISHLIDSNSRKKILKANEICNSAFLFAVLAATYIWGTHNVMLDFSALISVELFLFVAYQTYMALATDVVKENSIAYYNGLSEILGQLPVLLGSFTSSLIFLAIGFRGLIIIGIALHLSALYELRRIEERLGANPVKGRKNSLLLSMAYLRGNFSSVFFIFLLNVPFMAIIAGNLLKPIFLASYLNGNASLLADSEAIYATLAMVTGFIAPLLMRKIGEMRSVYIFTAVFFLGSMLIPAVPVLQLYLVFQMLHGFGNPGIRIARNSMAMRSIPPGEMGMFNGSVSLLTIIGRLIIMGFCILALNYIGVKILLFLLGPISLFSVAIAGVMWKRNPELNDRFYRSQKAVDTQE